jgi:hypothetical protein
VIAQ